jgi:peptide/nickel transport system substrate-binding protein
LKNSLTDRIIGLFVGFLLTNACVDPAEQAPPGTLVVSQEQAASWSRNFNPLLPSGTARWAATACIYEPLLIFNTVTQEWVARLASEFHWVEEGTVLAMKIRPGVRWSDGTPFSVQDVLYTFSLLKEVPLLDSGNVWSFIESIEPQEDSWIHFQFQRPYVPGLAHIGHQLIVPEHIFSEVEQPETFSNPNPVGTGPFTEILKFDQQVWDLGRNPFFWQEGKPMVEALRFPAFPDNDQANVALIRGEVDWAGNFVPAIDRIYVDRDPEHHHYWFPLISSTIFLYANTQRENLRDPRIRKALSYAIDRQRVTRVGMYEYTQAASPTGLSLAHNKWIDKSLEASSDWTQYEPDRTVELLEEAGLKRDSKGRWMDANNELLSFEVTVPAGWSDWVRSCQVMVQGFKEIGIDARLVTRDFSAWLHSVQHGDFDLAMGWSQSGVTPYEFFKGLMSTETVQPIGELSGSNWHRFGLPAVDELLTAFEGISDPSEQAAIMNQLQALFAQEVPAIPLFPGPAWGAYNDKRFTGFPSADNPYAVLSPNRPPESLLVLTELKPR